MIRLFFVAALLAYVNGQIWTKPLTLNTPYQLSIAQALLPGQRGQFELTVPAASVADLTKSVKISLSTLSTEEPLVYADFRQAATAGNARYVRTEESKVDGNLPVFYISNRDFQDSLQTPPYKLYISVECRPVNDAACYFSIVGSANAQTVLWPGFQLSDSVVKGGVNYYEFKPSYFNNQTYPTGQPVADYTANSDIQITLVPVRGRVSVYILPGSFAANTRPSPTNNRPDWSVANYNNEVILIAEGAVGRPSSNTFVIAVYFESAPTVNNDAEATFYIQGTFRTELVLSSAQQYQCRWLTPDIPVPSQSVEGGGSDELESYCFLHLGNNCAFDISLTVISGEQDMILFWQDGRNSSSGDEPGSDNIHQTPAGVGFFNVIVLTRGVGSYGEYNLLYTKSCGTQTRLMGLPNAEDTTKALIQAEKDMESMQNDMAPRLAQVKELLEATRESSQLPIHFSAEEEGAEVDTSSFVPKNKIVERDENAEFFPSIAEPHHDFQLNSVTAPSKRLAITAQPKSFHAIQLTSGQAQYGEAVDGQIIRFVYHPFTYNDDMTFELLRDFGGNPDIYISPSTMDTLPTPTNYQWNSSQVGADYVVVDKYDDYACVRRGCYYNVAVYIASTTGYGTGYTLVASEGEAHTNLQNNVPYTNRLVAAEPDYLRFVVYNPGQTITIRLVDNDRANPRMYVSTLVKFPNATNYQWQGTSTSVLTIGENSNPSYCMPNRTNPCTYYIGVRTLTPVNTTYTITASAGGPIELRHGVYQLGQVNRGEMAQYYFQVTPGYKRFSSSLTLLSGQAEFYVGNSVAPVRGQPNTYVGFRNSTSTINPITIDELSALACTMRAGKCSFYLAVYGLDGGDLGVVQFAIQGFTGDRDSVGVLNGRPILTTIAPNQTYYYYAPLTENYQRVQVCVTLLSGSVTGYWSDVDDVSFPDASNYKDMWRVNRGYGCIAYGAARKGQWYWSVANPSLNSTARVSVLFLTQVGDNDRAYIQPLDGTPSAVYLTGYTCEGGPPCAPADPNQRIYFSYMLDRTVPRFEVLLYNLIAQVDTDLYMNYIPVGSPTRWPNSTNYDYASARDGTDLIAVTNARAGRYLGVITRKPDTFSAAAAMITVSTGLTAFILQNNVPSRGFAAGGTFKWYQFVVTDQNADVFVEVVGDTTSDDPDLYARSGTAFPFTISEAIWRSAGGQTDVIEIKRNDANRPTSTQWTLTIGVYSFGRDASYTITARMSNGYFIEVGTPMQGSVQAGQWHYYAFRPRDIDSRIDVMLQPLPTTPRSQPAMAISNNWFMPSMTNRTYDWYKYSYGEAVYIELENDGPDRPYMCQARGIPLNQCIYFLGIFGSANADAQYIIRVDQPGTAIQLPNKVLLTGTIPAGGTVYYRFDNRESDPTVAFLLTPLVGEADMYVSVTTNRPSPNNFNWSSNLEGFDIVSIRPADPAITYYYIAVYNPTSSRTEYTIIGKAYNDTLPGDGADLLVEGVPQIGFTPGNGYSYYRFYVSGTWSELKITLEPLQTAGDPDLFVNRAVNDWPRLGNSEWQSRAGSGQVDEVIIPDPPAGYLYIAVQSYDSQNTYYRIRVTGAGRSTPISFGQVYKRDLAADQWDYFSVVVNTIVPNASLVFSVTPQIGDPDLFVSDRYRFPNLTYYNWTGRLGEGSRDMVIVDQSKGLRAGSYFVGIQAWGMNATYYLMAQYASRGQLLDGVSISTVIRQAGVNYYDLRMPAGLEFIVTVNTVSTLNNYAYVYMNAGDNDPTEQQSTWKSDTPQRKRQEFSVTNPTPGPCDRSGCLYRIGVFAPAEVASSSFTVVIIAQSANTVTPLVPGTPQDGTAPAGGYKHYRFQLTCARTAVTITLTPQGGNVDLLVNRGPQFPIRALDNVMFESNNTGTGVDRVSFDWRDPAIGGRNMVGTWYISVLNEASVSVNYNLVLVKTDGDCSWIESSSTGGPQPGSSSTGGSTGGGSTGVAPSSSGSGPIGYIQLSEGIPVWGEGVRNSYTYYSFTLPSGKPWPYTVHFTLVPLVEGDDPDLYIRKDLTFPTNANAQWSSARGGNNDDIVSIRPTDPVVCNPTQGTCTYSIGVFAYPAEAGGETAEWSILATTAEQPVFGLELDRTLTGRSIASRQWYYYVVNVKSTALPLVTIVTPLSGNPDLYVEYNRLPDFNSPTSKTFGVDIVTINPVQQGLYYIGVYGESTSQSGYSIVTSQGGIQLMPGQPQDDVLNNGQQRFYYFDFKADFAENAPFNLQLDAIAFNPLVDIYVRSDNQPLTPTSYTWTIGSGTTWPLSLTVPRGAPGYVYNGRYRILVVSRSETSAFAITASKGAATPIYLTNGRPVDSGANAVQSNEFRYYRVYVTNTERDLVWSLSMQQGSATLFLSPDVALPGPGKDQNKYSNATANGPSIVIRVPSRELRVGWYYASVRADWSSIRYTIAASSGSTLLQVGDSQHIQCSAGTTNYVLYLPWKTAESAETITFYATPNDWVSQSYTGNVQMYITKNANNMNPGAGNADWTTTSWNWVTPFKIGKWDPILQACIAEGNCQLNIGISCPANARAVTILLNVEVGSSLMPILPSSAGGYTQGADLDINQERHYTSAVSSGLFAEVVLETCKGQTALLVNYEHTTVPSMGDADQASIAKNTLHHITIPRKLNDKRLFMTVQGMSKELSTYKLYSIVNNSWADSSPHMDEQPTIDIADSSKTRYARITASIPTAEVPEVVRSRRIRAPSGFRGQMRYFFYYTVDGDTTEDATTFTECGLQRSAKIGQRTAVPPSNFWTDDQLDLDQNRMTISVTNTKVRYSVTILASYWWVNDKEARRATPGYIIYPTVHNIRAGTGGDMPPEPEESSTGPAAPEAATSVTWKIMLAFACVLAVVFGAVGYHYYKKNKNSVPVHNVLGLDSNFSDEEGNKMRSLLDNEVDSSASSLEITTAPRQAGPAPL